MVFFLDFFSEFYLIVLVYNFKGVGLESEFYIFQILEGGERINI